MPPWFQTSPLELAITLLDRFAPRRPSVAEHIRLGQQGELAALFYLRRQGFAVVAGGWKQSGTRGDLDLIAWEGDTLAIVEVKTRTRLEFATAESAVNRHKREVLRRLARQYIRHVPGKPVPRFDVLSIYGTELDTMAGRRAARYDLFRNAFAWRE
jgi:putative endonuclease